MEEIEWKKMIWVINFKEHTFKINNLLFLKI